MKGNKISTDNSFPIIMVTIPYGLGESVGARKLSKSIRSRLPRSVHSCLREIGSALALL
ncbi:hypothetical protein GF338_12565 [candidate division WOR-3 bacterium]|nr:hypothetical protein [candidate division WOR-3 bacterium]